MITAQVETTDTCLEELKQILPLHYKELAMNQDVAELDPEWGRYLMMEDEGKLLVFTLRDKGELVGYFVGFIMPELHYRQVLACMQDIFYVHPDHRGRRGGLIMFAGLEKELKRRGVKRWHVNSKVHADASPLFERLGFEKVETMYSKVL